MISPEITILLIIISILFVAYVFIYPFFVGADLTKWLTIDLLFSTLALVIVGFLFWETEFSFKLIFINLNWFWFTLIAYGLIEIPLSLRYAKKHKFWGFDSPQELNSGERMSDTETKPIWYDLQYEFNEEEASPTVLYTSTLGLNTLIECLQKIQSQAITGRIALDANDVDNFYGLPFSHLEISKTPPQTDEEMDSYSMKPFIWGGILILFIVMLAGYGLFDLMKAFF